MEGTPRLGVGEWSVGVGNVGGKHVIEVAENKGKDRGFCGDRSWLKQVPLGSRWGVT